MLTPTTTEPDFATVPQSPVTSRDFVSVYPTLNLRALLPRPGRREAPAFPFTNSRLHYYYLARNGIYALAQHWNLAGQEVLFPAYFHGVELQALLAAGVRPRFYPVHGNMEVRAEEVISAITPETRAVYVIHYLGFPGPVEQLAEECRERGLPLIEDCALALLSCQDDQPLGSFGDAAIFCIYKSLPVPNGGALLIREGAAHVRRADAAGKPLGSAILGEGIRHPPLKSTLVSMAPAIWRDLKYPRGGPLHRFLYKLRTTAKSSLSDNTEVVPVGTNELDPSTLQLGMSGICRRIVSAQPFGDVVERRRRNFLHLIDRLKGIVPLVYDVLPDGVCPLFFPVLTSNKVHISKRLFEVGIESVNFWSLHEPQAPKGMFPEVDRLRETVLELPCHQDVSPKDIERLAGELWKLRSEL